MDTKRVWMTLEVRTKGGRKRKDGFIGQFAGSYAGPDQIIFMCRIPPTSSVWVSWLVDTPEDVTVQIFGKAYISHNHQILFRPSTEAEIMIATLER